MSSEPEAARADVPSPGDVIAGKYVVESVLGLGGMGMVLAARHTSLRQRVAIKLLLPEVLKSEEAQRRFLREARAAGEIASEHVARVRDFGTLESGAPYLVMEHLDGVDLKQRIGSLGPLPVSDAVDYVLQACEALIEAHNAGIVHRDLKPANLFLTKYPDGSPLIKVLDFGISKAACLDSVGHDGNLTRTDSVLGSPVYMSPEQIRSPRDVDLRTDIWSIGSVLFELLAGVPPFDADNVAMLSARIVVDPPRSLRDARPEVPPELEAVVLKCLEKEPPNRYASVAELALALEPFATESARVSLGRIARLGERPGALDATALAEVAPAAATTAGLTGVTPGRSRRVLPWAVAGALAVGAAAALILSGTPSRSEAEAAVAATSSAAVTANVAASASDGPAAPPKASVAPEIEPSQPVPSAAEPKPAPRPSAPTPKTGAKKCPAGEVESKGHCCPVGLVWQSNRCERPLATKM